MVIEGGSSFTIPDTVLLCNSSSVNLEGGSSYIHLDDYIEWNPPRVIPWVFPLMSGRTVTLNLLETIVKAERARGAPVRCDSGGWLFSDITREGVIAPDLSRQPSLLFNNALTGLGICSELAFGLYALTTT